VTNGLRRRTTFLVICCDCRFLNICLVLSMKSFTFVWYGLFVKSFTLLLRVARKKLTIILGPVIQLPEKSTGTRYLPAA
jgi:hypothetical protein